MSSNIVSYTATEHKKMVGGKEVTVRNLKPVFTNDEERQKAKQHIQNGLYNVFSRFVG